MAEQLSEVDLQDLRGLLEADVSPTPWPDWLVSGKWVSSADRVLLTAAVNALPALLDLIRRQDAALTAVRELADALDIDAASEAMEAESDELDPHQMERQMGRSEGTQSAADALRVALASPDTTQGDQP